MDTARRDLAQDVDRHLARWRATGDPQAFGAIFDATSGALFRVALTLVPDPATAEDVLQQTFSVAVKKLRRLPVGQPVMPWLVNVLGKEALKANRSLWRHPDPARRLRPDALPVEAGIAGAEQEEAVRKAIDALEEPYRSAALLRWRYGLEPAEIAHVRGEPPGTTRSILSRALDRLRGTLRGAPVVWLAGPGAPRGLAAVRAEVVREAAMAATATAVAGGVAAVLGGLAVKKVILGALAVVLLLCGYAVLRPIPAADREPPAPSPGPDPAAAPGLARSADPARPAKAVGEDGEDRSHGGVTGSVQGTVTSPDGRPVRDAFVVLYTRGREDLIEVDSQRPDPGIRLGTSSTDGRFEVPMPAGDRASLVVLARGYSTWYADPVVSGDRRDVVLRPSAVVKGRVMDMKGRPIEGASVSLYVLVGAFHTERHATTAADGAYRLEDVPTPAARTGFFSSRFVVDAKGYARQILDLRQELGADVAPGAEAEVNVVLVKAATVSGRVLSAATGGPVEGAKVILWSFDGLFHHEGEKEHPANPFLLGEAVTGADGRYSITGAPCRGFHDSPNAQPSLVTGVRIGSWLAAGKAGLTTTVHEVALADEGTQLRIDLTLREAFSIEGRVVDADGKPVSGAPVWASVMREGVFSSIPAPLRAEFPTEFATTDADGAWRMDGVAVPGPNDLALKVGAQSPNGIAGSPSGRPGSALVPVEGPYVGVRRVPDLVLPVEVLPWARVRVVGPDGAPVAGAEVGWWPTWLPERTDAEGRVRIVGSSLLPPAGQDPPPKPVFVHARGFALARAEVSLARTPGAEPPETLVRLAPGFRLTGRVETRGGSLPGDVVVSVGNGSVPVDAVFPTTFVPAAYAEAWRDYRSADVAFDGSFAVEDLPPGPYHVRATGTRADAPLDPMRRASGVSAVLSGVAAGADVTLVLPLDAPSPFRTIELTVVDSETEEAALKPWGELFSEGTRISGRRVEPGVLRFERVAFRTWQFGGGADGYVTVVVSGIEVSASSPSEPRVVRVTRGAVVSGQLKGPDGAPFVGQVMLEPFDSAVGKILSSVGAAGRYEARGVPPGRYRVTGISERARPSPGWSAAPDGALLEIPSGARDVALDMQFAEAGFLSAWSGDPRFQPASGQPFLSADQVALAKRCSLVVLDAAGRVVAKRDGFSASDPGVRWEGALPPGTYEVRLLVPDEPVLARRVDVAAGRRTQAQLSRP